MKDLPLLSIILNNYNHVHYLEKRFQDLLNGLPSNVEIIFFDDGSTDNSMEIAQRWEGKDERLKIFSHKPNLGIHETVRKAVELAQGKYIAPRAVDDLHLLGAYAKVVSVLETQPDVPLLFSDHAYIDEKVDLGKLCVDRTHKTLRTLKVFSPEEVAKEIFEDHLYIPGHTVVIKKESFLRFGGYQPQLKHLTDWFVYHAIALNEGAIYMPEALFVWRLHQSNYSASFEKQRGIKKELLQSFLDQLTEVSPNLRRRFSRSGLFFEFLQSVSFFELKRFKDFSFWFNCYRKKIGRIQRKWRRSIQKKMGKIDS